MRIVAQPGGTIAAFRAVALTPPFDVAFNTALWKNGILFRPGPPGKKRPSLRRRPR